MTTDRPWKDRVIERDSDVAIRIPLGWSQVRAEIVMLDYDQCVAGNPVLKAGGDEDFIDYCDFMDSSGIGDVLSNEQFLVELRAINGIEFDHDGVGVRWATVYDRMEAWASVGAPVFVSGSMRWIAALLDSAMGTPLTMVREATHGLRASYPWKVDVVVRNSSWAGSSARITVNGERLYAVWTPAELRVALDMIRAEMSAKEDQPWPSMASPEPSPPVPTLGYQPIPKRHHKVTRDRSGLIPVAILLAGVVAVAVAYLCRLGGN